ncbi:Subtilase family protein [Micromonospora viridifaciens]|uniref:Subtilase family protein n=1 Tax=Micromonospora viridifaciens TaxID=1881 RepID=A0A1C4VN46_MICVI|nr:S8 family serine peptidase [Micromonospora viridifaciens]SCE85383.1 Subtilase family protein [Micromonospora viridifaciens]
MGDIRGRLLAAGLLAGLMVLGVAQPADAAPRRAEQWYLDELRIDQAHRLSTGRGVIVAVVDTGVDATHPDIRGRVLPGGRSYGASGDGRSDTAGHGTHMAGIIAATNASRDGVIGIAPDAKIRSGFGARSGRPYPDPRLRSAARRVPGASGNVPAARRRQPVLNMADVARGNPS